MDLELQREREAQALANLWFQRLVELLKDRKLPCENMAARVVPPDEFMFMQEANGIAYFKHRDTRNYIEVRLATKRDFSVPTPSGYELFVPFTQDAFRKGFFDLL